jgi:hypothetical protein
MAQITGRITIVVRGVRLSSKEGATLTFADIGRKGVAGDTGVLGYSESTQIPQIEATIAHDARTRLEDYKAMVDETISFDADTGTSYVLRNAWCDPESLVLSGGEVKITFQGVKCEEVGA